MRKEGNSRDYDFDNNWRSMESWIREVTFSLLDLLSTELKFPNLLILSYIISVVLLNLHAFSN